MITKAAIISEILREVRKAQTEKWAPPPGSPVKRISFPPALWLGDGRSLNATEALLRAVSGYTRICWENDPALKPRFKIDELNKLEEQSFGFALAQIDLDLSDEQLHPVVSDRVAELLGERIERHDRPIVLTLGCHLIEGDEPFPILIGPVLFETREYWRQRMLTAGKLSRPLPAGSTLAGTARRSGIARARSMHPSSTRSRMRSANVRLSAASKLTVCQASMSKRRAC
jgi:hypothetical protein